MTTIIERERQRERESWKGSSFYSFQVIIVVIQRAKARKKEGHGWGDDKKTEEYDTSSKGGRKDGEDILFQGKTKNVRVMYSKV